jgi:demethylmenaquinone methyltransferase/2-methoxy-6-polyprenyl-1,4-benzoquinol methylase
VVGADFCLPMLQVAARKGLRPLVVADGTRLPFADGAFDAVTVAFGLRNMESWPGALREMSRVLRRDGHLLILDFSMPRPPFSLLYRFYLHRILPRVAGLLTGNRAGYEYLGESIESFPSGAAMERLLEASGFRAPRTLPLAAGIVSIYTARRSDT